MLDLTFKYMSAVKNTLKLVTFKVIAIKKADSQVQGGFLQLHLVLQLRAAS